MMVDTCRFGHRTAFRLGSRTAEALIAPDRRAYYGYAVLTEIAINRDSNHMLLMIARAVRDAKAGNLAKAKEEAHATLADFAEIKSLEAQSSYGKWANWCRGEWLVGIDETHQWVDTFLRWLDDPQTTLPPPVLNSGWEGYYHIFHYEGDATVDIH